MGCAQAPCDPAPNVEEGKAAADADIEVPKAPTETYSASQEQPPTTSSARPRTSSGADDIAVAFEGGGKEHIRRSDLPDAVDLMSDTLPDWQFELNQDQWKSYPMQESVQLDRFWQVFSREQGEGGTGAHLAKVKLMKREGEVDFKAMTCQVGTGRARQLRRLLKESGWLSNKFFFEAFKSALGKAGVDVEEEPEDMFDFRYNQDFRQMKDDGRKLKRGGQIYSLPIGWNRFAVKVQGVYDDGDNKWLKEDDSGWAVAYHGTSGDSLPGILSSGFRVGDRQKFADATGAGIYCTPWIDVAQHYSRPQKVQGRYIQIILQLRVKPSSIRPISDAKATAFERKYWVINEPDHIRAYGVLIREHHLRDWVPPEAMVFGNGHPVVQEIMKKLREEIAQG